MQRTDCSNILVTGGAGFVGSHICEQLLLSGMDVIIVDVLNSETSTVKEKKRHIELLKDVSRKKKVKIKVYKEDILNERHLVNIIKNEKPDCCIHAAALVMDRKSVQEPIRYIINNVKGTQSLLNAIRLTDTIKRLVFISSRSAVGETSASGDLMTENDLLRPINPYGATKAAAEALCHAFHKNFGISVSICRMHPLYGPRCRRDMMPRLLFESVLNNTKVEKYGNGDEAIRDWLYVEDAAIGILAVLKCYDEFSIFNFGTGIATSLNELIQIVLNITGGELNLKNKERPLGDAVFAGLCDRKKVKEILSWEPKIDLKTGLTNMYKYMIKEKTDKEKI
ncbi:MAG: NAD(P)-dependent oxidoreductase [Calditrichaeota bacterium]|nr:MAG: NAD(P)-dependent oxidoreductase [Calditrichota bacterium]